MTKLYWHFLTGNGRMQFGKQKVEVDKTYRIKQSPVLCERGFHASKKVMDALFYAPGTIACLVRLGGTIVEDTDKVVAQERTVVAMADATAVLHEAACHFAEQALHKERHAGREPHPNSWNAIRVKRRWLKGIASDKELTAARSAAWSAARSAAWSALEPTVETLKQSARDLLDRMVRLTEPQENGLGPARRARVTSPALYGGDGATTPGFTEPAKHGQDGEP